MRREVFVQEHRDHQLEKAFLKQNDGPILSTLSLSLRILSSPYREKRTETLD